MCFGFGQKKGNQLISGRTFGSDFDFLVIKNIFGSNYFHKIENNLTVESAGIIAGCQDAVAITFTGKEGTSAQAKDSPNIWAGPMVVTILRFP